MSGSSFSPSRSDSTAFQLKQEILSGRAKPGDRLAESAVAQRLGVSRVPVREALFSLEREGLVEFSATGRAFVRDLTPQDCEELFVVRLTLEPVAARLAAPHLKDDCRRLEQNVAATRRAQSVGEVTRLDLEFHQLILDAAGNARLLKLWGSLRAELELWLGRLHRQHEGQNLATRGQTADSHQQIMEGFQSLPPAACERLMRGHILGWREWLPVMEGKV